MIVKYFKDYYKFYDRNQLLFQRSRTVHQDLTEQIRISYSLSARKSDVQEEQVLAALIRVINRPNSLGLKPARQLYRWLLDGRFCSNKDVFIELFVEKTLQR